MLYITLVYYYTCTCTYIQCTMYMHTVCQISYLHLVKTIVQGNLNYLNSIYLEP